MKSILGAKFLLLFRKPMMFIGTTLLSLVFAYFLGSGNYEQISIPVYSEIQNLEETDLWEKLNRSDTFFFSFLPEEEAIERVQEGKGEAAVHMMDDGYKLFIVKETPNLSLIKNYLDNMYSEILLEKELQNVALENQGEVINKIEQVEKEPLFAIESLNFRGEDAVVIDMRLQTVFGLSLFFVIYTISNNLLHILQEKKTGVWDRLILSPLKKWQMYAGNLIYSFIVGYMQVALIFVVFRFWVGLDFYGGFWKSLLILIPYVFAIVALSMFLIGVVKTVQQFNAAIPIISVSMAMIGGAYWPLEIVKSEILLELSKWMPITYAMEALKEVTIYGGSISEAAYPLSILLLIGVAFIGIGINVMERRGA